MTTTPTPSSEIIHLVTTYVDAVDSLPPSLARSLSDLKELDAVLNGALDDIVSKLGRLAKLMHQPPTKSDHSTSTDSAAAAADVTPLDRLKLLREIAEDARVFRLGGDDKIRVATNTCETVATHSAHLSTLSTLLLSFLPAHLLPLLPGPAAPHGYPQSSSLSSQIARRQLFDYPSAKHPGQGSTARLNGALGMVREHYDLVRGGAAGAQGGGAGAFGGSGAGGFGSGGPLGMSGGRGYGGGGAAAANGGGAAATGPGSRKRAAQIDYSVYGDDYPPVAPVATGNSRRAATDATGTVQRHPNQYTKKRQAAAAAAAAAAAQAQGGMSPALQQGGAFGHPPYGAAGGPPISAQSINAAAGIYNTSANFSQAAPSSGHPFGMTAVEAVKEKRRGADGTSGAGSAGQAGHSHHQQLQQQQQQQQMHFGGGSGAMGGHHAGAPGSVGAAAMAASGSGSRAGSVGIGAIGSQASNNGAGYSTGAMAYGAGYSGMATPEEYNMAMHNAGQRAPAKRKVDDNGGASKRRKKGVDSPDLSARTLPASSTSSRAPRRGGNAASSRAAEQYEAAVAATVAQDYPLAAEEEYDPALEGADDDGDKTLYCFCQRVSFGEMIACDAPDCEHEWFHLPCVGLKSIPDGRWFCDECRRNSKAGKKRR